MNLEQRLRKLESISGKDIIDSFRLVLDDRGSLSIYRGQYAGSYDYIIKNGKPVFKGVTGERLKFLKKKMAEPGETIKIEFEPDE